jgi:nicotinamidase/pyrazinamidase
MAIARNGELQITPQDVLLVIDLQNDFCPGGALAVADGDAVLDPIHRLAPKFDHIVLTQDWHPPSHSSFASAHPGKRPFEQIGVSYGTQTLWPNHCVQGSKGAEFHPSLRLPQAELILRKGFRPHIDSYSAFFENDRSTATGLAGYLRERNLIRVFLAGLAYDFCVGYSALDARRLGFEAIILLDACRAIDLNGSVEKIESEFAEAGVVLMDSADVINDADVEEAIRQGQEDASQGKIRQAKEFFDEFETTHPELE